MSLNALVIQSCIFFSEFDFNNSLNASWVFSSVNLTFDGSFILTRIGFYFLCGRLCFRDSGSIRFFLLSLLIFFVSRVGSR